MRHFVNLSVEVKSHDDNSFLASPQSPLGPVVSLKQIAFAGIGANLDDAIEQATTPMIAFLQSDAVKLGSTSPGKIISGFPGKPPSSEQ